MPEKKNQGGNAGADYECAERPGRPAAVFPLFLRADLPDHNHRTTIQISIKCSFWWYVYCPQKIPETSRIFHKRSCSARRAACAATKHTFSPSSLTRSQPQDYHPNQHRIVLLVVLLMSSEDSIIFQNLARMLLQCPLRRLCSHQAHQGGPFPKQEWCFSLITTCKLFIHVSAAAFAGARNGQHRMSTQVPPLHSAAMHTHTVIMSCTTKHKTYTQYIFQARLTGPDWLQSLWTPVS